MKPDVNKPVENPILSRLLKEYREASEAQKRDVLEKIYPLESTITVLINRKNPKQYFAMEPEW